MAYPLAMMRGWLVFLLACSTSSSTAGDPCERYVARELECRASHIKTDQDRQLMESASRSLCKLHKVDAKLACLTSTTDCTAYKACTDKVR